MDGCRLMGDEAWKVRESEPAGAVASEAHRHWQVGNCALEVQRRRRLGWKRIRGGMMVGGSVLGAVVER